MIGNIDFLNLPVPIDPESVKEDTWAVYFTTKTTYTTPVIYYKRKQFGEIEQRTDSYLLKWKRPCLGELPREYLKDTPLYDFMAENEPGVCHCNCDIHGTGLSPFSIDVNQIGDRATLFKSLEDATIAAEIYAQTKVHFVTRSPDMTYMRIDEIGVCRLTRMKAEPANDYFEFLPIRLYEF